MNPIRTLLKGERVPADQIPGYSNGKGWPVPG
jgi:hypothetical protein